MINEQFKIKFIIFRTTKIRKNLLFGMIDFLVLVLHLIFKCIFNTSFLSVLPTLKKYINSIYNNVYVYYMYMYSKRIRYYTNNIVMYMYSIFKCIVYADVYYTNTLVLSFI